MKFTGTSSGLKLTGEMLIKKTGSEFMFLEFIAVSPSLSQCDVHQHNEWEICLNISGFGVNFFQQEEVLFSTGSIYICPPLCEHRKISPKGTFQDVSILVSDADVLSRIKSYHLNDNSNNDIKTLMFMLYDIYHTRPLGYQAVANSIAETICNMLMIFDGGAAFSPAVEIVRNEIIKNFMNPEFRIDSAIKHANYNPDYMRRCFRKEMGMSPLVYMNKLRIENAKKLLQQIRQPSYTITEIANMSGFYDICYFSRVFRKATGTTPTQMQKNSCHLAIKV